MNHYQALNQLMPINLSDASNKDMEAEGALLDAAGGAVASLTPEFFPTTVAELLGRWEAEYDIIPRPEVGPNDRRRAVLAKYISVGSLTKAHFTALANALGYDVIITEGGEEFVLFRAGISKAGDMVYSAGVIWYWQVATQNKPPATDIKTLFADLTPPHTRLEFTGQ